MKNILITFFKVCGLSLIAGMTGFLLLFALFNDAIERGYIIFIAQIFIGGLTVLLTFALVYLPIYYLNKNIFENESIKELFERYLPIVVIPITLILLIIIINKPELLNEGYFLVMGINSYLITFFSFWQFVSFIKS